MLTGIPGARRDIVLLNAAAALVAAGLAGDLKQGVQMGAEAIDSGQAAATLEKLRRSAKSTPWCIRGGQETELVYTWYIPSTGGRT